MSKNLFYRTVEARAFDREVEGKVLQFESAGRDVKGNLVMKDKKTKSLWLAKEAKALKGKWKGKKLYPIPATPILKKRFKAFYPKGDIYK